MKPYYNHNRITIYHGDCLEIMPQLKSKTIDLVLADPPYGTTACKWDSIIPLEPMWKELKRLIKPNGVIIMTASQPFTTTLISSNIKMFKYEWIWNKVTGANFMNLKNRPFKTHEEILVFSKTSDFTFNPIRTSRTKKSLKRYPAGKGVFKIFPNANKQVEYYGTECLRQIHLSEDGLKHPVDIITFCTRERGHYKIRHPTKKPVALMKYLIKTYTNENETILDFTMGSGTTLVAAKELNRKAIGIEIEEKYCEIAIKRLAQDILPLR